jgi:hypothetical protein
MTTPTDATCGLLVAVSITPAVMIECGLLLQHEGPCVPYTNLKKRQVSYNQDAVLCPECKKRIRLNNNGRVRIHIMGKLGSKECPGSDTQPGAVEVKDKLPRPVLTSGLFSGEQ